MRKKHRSARRLTAPAGEPPPSPPVESNPEAPLPPPSQAPPPGPLRSPGQARLLWYRSLRTPGAGSRSSSMPPYYVPNVRSTAALRARAGIPPDTPPPAAKPAPPAPIAPHIPPVFARPPVPPPEPQPSGPSWLARQRELQREQWSAFAASLQHQWASLRERLFRGWQISDE
jgi:hypothetical protein